MMTIVSKGNGKNFYGYENENSIPVEVVKIRGSFYLTKYKHGTLTPVGDALTKNTFTIVEKTEDEREF